MSDESQDHSAENKEGELDLTSLNFGPAWARDAKESKNVKKFKDRADRDGDRRGGGGGRRHHGGGGGRRDDRRGGDRRGGGKFQDKGRGRRDGGRPQREEVEPPPGFTLRLMPLEESLDVLAKEIIQTGRTYSVFDLAKVCLQGRDRFRATFEHADKKFIRCREDNSVWLNKEEALRQLWRGDWLAKFYRPVEVEAEAPTGNFQSVAKCGLSGEWLGPPNHHAYQQNISTLHHERFGHLSLDTYKNKIVVEHGEESVNAWLESMKTVTKWRETTAEDLAADAEQAAKAEETKPAKKEEMSTATAESTEDEPVSDAQIPESSEATPEEAPTPEPSESAADGEAPENEEAVEPATVSEPPVTTLFDSSRDVERHFLTHHFDKAFEETNRAWVSGDIPAKFLSPGLLTLLKRTVQEEKRYPAKLMPVVCRQLSGRHIAVFKWEKKLKVGPSRPHAVPEDLNLAERPQAMIDYLHKHSGCELAQMWSALFPEDTPEETKHEWYHDFHWILNQGHAILLADTTVHLAKKGPAQTPPDEVPKQKESDKEDKAKEASPEASPPAEKADPPTANVTPPADAPSESENQ